MILNGRRRQDKTKHVSLTKGDMILMGLNFMDYDVQNNWLTNDTCHEQQQYFSNIFFSKEKEKTITMKYILWFHSIWDKSTHIREAI